MVAVACLSHAGSAGAFAISPLKQQITVAPGAEGQIVAVAVLNEEAQKMSYAMKVMGAKQLENGRLVYGTGISPAEQWVRAETGSVEIEPGQTKDVCQEHGQRRKNEEFGKTISGGHTLHGPCPECPDYTYTAPQRCSQPDKLE